MSHVSFTSTSKSEWLKFRSVRSTMYNVIAIFVLSIGLGALIAVQIASHYSEENPARQLLFDPLAYAMIGVFFAQFVVGVLGSMFITSEYSTSSIRTTLAAVPKRGLLVAAKLAVMLITVFVMGEIIAFCSFFIGQSIFASHAGVPHISISTPGALRGVFLTGLYLTFIGAMGFSFGLLLRKAAASIVSFVVVLLVLPGILQLAGSWGASILRYMPSELGTGMMSINQASGTFSPWVCSGIFALYCIALNGFGTWLLIKRDA